MKKNLSKNAVKSMAIGLAIAMGSSVAISGVSGNLVKAVAANDNFNNIQNPDFSTPMKDNDYVVTTENYLFKIKNFDGGKKTAKAIFVGKAILTSIGSSTPADGDNVPYAASLSDGVLTVAGSGDTSYTVTIDQIGDGSSALQQYTVQSGSAPGSPSSISELTKDEVNSVLAKATVVKTKAFDNIGITGTTENDKLILPATLTTLEAKAIGGVATVNTSNPVYIDAKAISNFANFDATSFDKDTAAQKRTVNVELANHTTKKAFDTKITGKDNVTSIEKQLPTVSAASYDGATTIILTASEDLKESSDLGNFTITKNGSRKAINVTNAKVERGALTSIKLTIDSAITENGTYSVQYAEQSSKEVKDANDNKLAAIDSGLEFTVDKTAPAVTSIEVLHSAPTEVIVAFDKQIKQKSGGNTELKAMFEVKKTAPNFETITISSAEIFENTKVKLTLAKPVAYGEVLNVSYTKDNTNNLQSNSSSVDVEDFAEQPVTNNVKVTLQQNDTIEAGGYTFKVLSGNQTVALTGKKLSRTNHTDGAVSEGVVSIGGNDVNVTEIGDGSDALTGDNFNVEELNNIIPNVTTIKTKAFDGKTLEGATKISFPKVTAVEANGLGIKAGCETVELPAVGSAEAGNVVANAFKATDATNSVTKLKVKEEAQASLSSKFDGVTVSKFVAIPTASQTIDMDNFQFTILTQDDDENEDTVGTVKLTKVESGAASGSDSGLTSVKLQDGVLSGEKEGQTFKYNFTEIDIQTGKENLDASKFETLDISKVTKIAASSFEGATLPAEVTFPLVTELGENSFKGVKGLTTLTLPGVKVLQVGTISSQAFGNNGEQTSVTTLKLESDTAYALVNHIANKNVKVKSIENASATVDNVVISGKKGEKLSQEIIIILQNEFFVSHLNDVTSWFTNLPEGLTAAVTKNQLKQAIVTISGTPTALSSEKVSITIPSKDLTFGENVLVNTEAKFDITEKPSTGGGSGSGSSSSSQAQSGSVSLNNKETVTSENTSEGTTAENKGEITTDTNIEFKELKIDEINLPTITDSAANFSDVPATHWASESIGKLSSAGIIKGVPGGGFNANGNSKRADVAIMLTRLLGLENQTSTARFSDVDPNAYYANAVGVAREYGIINGNADGTFNPESYISRQDTMVMISRILDNLNVSTNADTTVLAQFSDTANISSYALEATSKLVNLGIINGNEGKINPKHAITRAEMAVIMDRVYDIIDKTVKEEAAKETTTEVTSETTSSSESTTGTESTSTTETTTESTTQN